MAKGYSTVTSGYLISLVLILTALRGVRYTNREELVLPSLPTISLAILYMDTSCLFGKHHLPDVDVLFRKKGKPVLIPESL
ncbi:hypothetical protein GGS26DRAFT_544924, partial [Hypomontagnella submonticulosa]